jgi:hypothetical protein
VLFGGAVLCGILCSYIVSCTEDFGPFRKEWENLPKAIFYAWYAAVISLVSRVIFISLTLHILLKILIMVYPNGSRNWNLYVFVGAYCSALIITLPPRKISKILKKRAKEELQLKWWMKLLIRSDNLSWEKIISMLVFIRAEQTNEIWMGKDNRWAVFVLYEEKKDILVKYHFKNKRGFGEKLWLYLGLLSGNNNSKRAEALIHVYGTKWLRREIDALKEGRRTTSISVKYDRRKFIFNRLDNPPIPDLEIGKRKCDYLLLEFLHNL